MNVSMQGAKAAVFVEKLYEDIEFWYPYIRLQEAGIEVDVVAPKKGEYAGKHGMVATSDVTSEAALQRIYSVVVVPGGYSPDHMRRDRNMVEIVKRQAKSGRLLAIICHGPWMLNSAGLTRGLRLTSYFSIKDDLIAAGGSWVDEPVVRDNNIITAQGPTNLPEFMKTILDALSKHAGS